MTKIKKKIQFMLSEYFKLVLLSKMTPCHNTDSFNEITGNFRRKKIILVFVKNDLDHVLTRFYEISSLKINV